MNRELLTRPFPPEAIKSRLGQHNKTIYYVDVAAFIQRLNESCEVWSFTVEKYEILATEVVVLGRLVADGIVKMAFGGSSITIDKTGEIVSVADDLKSASSDSLKKCASLLGVGLEQMYGGQAQGAAPTRSTSSPTERVTSRQLATLHSSARKRGLSREALADMVHQRAGVAELAALTKSQASELISELTGTNGSGR